MILSSGCSCARRGPAPAPLVLAMVAGLLLLACEREAKKGVGLLGLKAPTTLPQDTIANPFVRTPEGLFTRTVFAGDDEGLHLEVRELYLPPNGKAEGLRWSGGVLLEVVSGDGRATVGGGEGRAFPIGSTLSLDEGTPLAIVADSTPVMVLAYLIATKRGTP